jgi:hypothetical protein
VCVGCICDRTEAGVVPRSRCVCERMVLIHLLGDSAERVSNTRQEREEGGKWSAERQSKNTDKPEFKCGFFFAYHRRAEDSLETRKKKWGTVAIDAGSRERQRRSFRPPVQQVWKADYTTGSSFISPFFFSFSFKYLVSSS